MRLNHQAEKSAKMYDSHPILILQALLLCIVWTGCDL